ncbi:hypothetical protein Dimus_011599, partial [Dionaea muscipula]
STTTLSATPSATPLPSSHGCRRNHRSRAQPNLSRLLPLVPRSRGVGGADGGSGAPSFLSDDGKQQRERVVATGWRQEQAATVVVDLLSSSFSTFSSLSRCTYLLWRQGQAVMGKRRAVAARMGIWQRRG